MAWDILYSATTVMQTRYFILYTLMSAARAGLPLTDLEKGSQDREVRSISWYVETEQPGVMANIIVSYHPRIKAVVVKSKAVK